MHLMALGMFLFEIGTLAYDEMQRKTDWQHARSQRVGARDATQFTGVGDETISLSGAVYAEIADGRVSLDDLRSMADDGEANVSPDNRWVFFTTSRNRRVQIARMMLDGTNERVISPIDGSWPQTRPISGPFQPAR